jgi:zinc transport system substrate-binding protein
MKKFAFFATFVLAAALTFVACSAESSEKTPAPKKVSIVATIYPQYAWLKEILGKQADSLNLTLLIKNGMDLHSYKPSAKDIATIAKADMIVYVGGESDEWIEKALEATPNEKRVQANLLAALGDRVKAEEIVEGMQAEDEHHHEHAEEHEHEEHHEHAEEHEHHEHEAHAEEVENDEHVWLSLKNAEILVKALTQAVVKLDATHEAEYRANADAYIAKISELDEAYRVMVAGATHKTVLFGDRFPFRYLVDDYGIKYYAAFVGCSAESEASFETVAFLANKMDSLALPAIFTIDGGNGKIAEAVLAASKKSKAAEVLTINSMQSVKTSQMDSASYLDIMRENLEVIKKALK